MSLNPFKNAQSCKQTMQAISNAHAIIEFMPDGTVIDANPNFCSALGYRREEILGQKHSLFVTPEEVSSPDYSAFWDALRAERRKGASSSG